MEVSQSCRWRPARGDAYPNLGHDRCVRVRAVCVLTKVYGLTGGIGSGKSTVTRALRERGVPVIDLDVIAREVVQPGTSTLKRLTNTFGKEILNDDGTLNRGELGRRAFADKEQTRKLNAITHGAIRQRMVWYTVKLWLMGARRVVLDTPLLIEAGLYRWCAGVIIVYCSEDQQLRRMMLRDAASKGLTEEDARQRLAAQMPLHEKLEYADRVIDNSSDAPGDGEPPHITKQIDALCGEWQQLFRSPPGFLGWAFCWLCPPVGLLWGALVAHLHARSIDKRRAHQTAAAENRKSA